jgi:glycine hydroxymethyltransferase
MSDFLFRGSLGEIDPVLEGLADLEAERQYRKIILIPSESTAPFAVRQALASAFQNIYAEGYPATNMRTMTEEQILDLASNLGHHRRYSDRRYYKGTEYANIVESLARRRCAEAFATNEISPEEIFVNVQPLSGAPANNAVYHALIEPGDLVMGMDLLHGGHLTHGSPVNRSGKLYRIISYCVDDERERIDYDQIQALADEHKPKLIIAGYSSYPWSVDWSRFRAIADSCGAFLLADVAHVAGLIVADEYPSPIGIADVITFTTHKSLCGPRGAAILTTSRSLSRKINRAVFPGEQGGPHINTIMAQAVAFKLAKTEQFTNLQRQIRLNALAMTEVLQSAGFRIPYGGTDTHMANMDVSSITGPDGSSLSGDQAARILDLAGIIVNRNTIPGDSSALNPSGLRFGSPWITQRGFTEAESVQLAEMIANLLKACTPFSISGRGKLELRSKVNFGTLNETRIRVRDLAESKGIDFEPKVHGYPHFYYLDDPQPEGAFAEIQLSGPKADDFLRWITKSRLSEMKSGDALRTSLYIKASTFDSSKVEASSIETTLVRGEDPGKWTLYVASSDTSLTLTWLRDLSDGFVVFDEDDLARKLPGPVVIDLVSSAEQPPEPITAASRPPKPWYLGLEVENGEDLPDFRWTESEPEELQRTALYDLHQELGAKMVPFAGWEMPVWYSSVLEEHTATRTAAGLFDVSHMGVFQVEGENAAAFLDSVVTNDVAALEVGESHYTQFLDPTANVIDDTMIYRKTTKEYLVVVNASNDAKDWAWLSAVHMGQVKVDQHNMSATVFGRNSVLRNLRDPAAGDAMRVDLALQGPKSREILSQLADNEVSRAQIHRLKWAGVMEGSFGGIPLVVSRTGYTGERVAYELFVHPRESVGLWKLLLEVGEPMGLKPIGLGARDSLRTEAGLPLYGHEMAGDMNLGVGDAGFTAYVKTYKPWFIGRVAFLDQERSRKRVVVRFRFNDKGVRMAHYGDPVVNKRGQMIGTVTSCALDRDGYLLGQAYIDRKHAKEETPIHVFQSASDKASKAPAALEVGDRVSVPTPASVLSRFM